MPPPSRMRTTTQRVETPFAALYVHLSTDGEGRAREVSISTPGKHHDTAMGDALRACGDALTALLQEAGPDETGPPIGAASHPSLLAAGRPPSSSSPRAGESHPSFSSPRIEGRLPSSSSPLAGG